MRKRGVAAERLRAFVRERVRPDGKHYQRGNATRLARHLAVDPAWVTQYADEPPAAHATLDQAIGICEFYGVTLTDLATAARRALPAHASAATRPAPTEDPLVADLRAALAAGVNRPLAAALVRTIQGLPKQPVPTQRVGGTRGRAR